MELHADCYAGVWAGQQPQPDRAETIWRKAWPPLLPSATIRLTGGRVSSDNFTHGTSQQRMAALRLGMQSGDDLQCDRQILQAGQ